MAFPPDPTTVPGATPNPLPPDLEAQIAQILRQRQMAQIQVAQGMQGITAPTQFSPGPYGQAVRGGPAMLANALLGYVGQKGLASSDQQIGQIGIQNEQQRQQELAALQAIPDMKTRIAQALASPRPSTQALGKDWQKNYQASLEKGAGLLGEGGNPAAGVESLVKGQLPVGYTPPPAPQPMLEKFPDPNNPGKFITGFKEVDPKTGKVSIHSAQGQTINVDTAGELAATKALGAQVPEVAGGARKEALDAQTGLENSRQILALAKDPQIISGFAANAQLGMASLATKLGFTGPDAVAKTQALLAAQARQTLAASTLLKGSISDKEKPFLEQASSGGLSFTPETIQHLAILSFAVNHNKLINAREQWQGAVSVPGAGAAPQMYPFPPVQHEIPEGINYREMPGGRLQYNEGLLNPPQAPAAPAKPLTIDQLTPAQKAELLKKLQGQ